MTDRIEETNEELINVLKGRRDVRCGGGGFLPMSRTSGYLGEPLVQVITLLVSLKPTRDWVQAPQLSSVGESI